MCIQCVPGAGGPALCQRLVGAQRECPARPRPPGGLEQLYQWRTQELERPDEFANVSITKYHTLGDLSNRDLFSHNSGGEESETKVSSF